MPIKPQPILIVSRPDPQGRVFADSVADRLGYAPQIILAPAFRIEAVPYTPPDAAEVIFTSVNGVKFAPPGKGHRAWCVGPATAQAAREMGYDPTTAGGDARSLTDLILSHRPRGPLVHLAGHHRRGDIAGILTAAGLTCTTDVVYRQVDLPTPAALLTAARGGSALVAPVFSPRSARMLDLPGRTAPLYVVAISDAVADAVAQYGPTQTLTAAQPGADHMMDATLRVWASLA